MKRSRKCKLFAKQNDDLLFSFCENRCIEYKCLVTSLPGYLTYCTENVLIMPKNKKIYSSASQPFYGTSDRCQGNRHRRLSR